MPIDPNTYLPAMQEAAEAIGAQMLTERYGQNELLTREALYRRLKIDIQISVNGLVDSGQRINNAVQLLNIAAAAGAITDGRPFVVEAARQMRMSDDIAGSIGGDPNAMLAEAVRLASANPQSVSEESIRIIQGLAGMLQNAAVASNPNAANQIATAGVEAAAQDGQGGE